MITIESLLEKRIVILDGPMGTMMLPRKGEKPACGAYADLLNFTEPATVENIHRQFLEAGADIIETNTFNANSISLQSYDMHRDVYELNHAAARLARGAAAGFHNRFVAGVVGPTHVSISMPPGKHKPVLETVTFDELVSAYCEQTRGLMDGGVDMLLAETIFDSLNGKAALDAFEKCFVETGRRVPVMVSITLTRSGRLLSGETVEEFWDSIRHAHLLSIGVNCSFGAGHMRPYVEKLSSIANVFVSCHPNAGLPDASGKYSEGPEDTAAILRDFASKGWLNLAGGCCGTTPAHIQAIAHAMQDIKPRLRG